VDKTPQLRKLNNYFLIFLLNRLTETVTVTEIVGLTVT